MPVSGYSVTCPEQGARADKHLIHLGDVAAWEASFGPPPQPKAIDANASAVNTALRLGKATLGHGNVKQVNDDVFIWDGWARLPMRDKQRQRVTTDMVKALCVETGDPLPEMKVERGRVFVKMNITFDFTHKAVPHA